MKQNFKRFLSLALAITMVFSMFTGNIAYAADEGFTEGDPVAFDDSLATEGETPDDGNDSEEPQEEAGDDVHEHVYAEVITEATCTVDGAITYTCECSDSYTEAIPAKGHTFEEGVCSVCGEVEVAAIDVVETNAAKLGETLYATLQDAINACAAGNNTITLLADCAETVTIKQTAGVNITIDGAGKIYSGTIKVDGNNRPTGTESLTIQNVNFKKTDATGYSYFINAEKNAAGGNSEVHNLTVDGCTFESNNWHYAIATRHPYNLVVKNCTANNVYYFIYNPQGGQKMTIENCSVSKATYGIGAQKCREVLVKNYTYTGKAAGFYGRANANGSVATLENVSINTTLNGQSAVALWKNDDGSASKTYTFILEGENTFTAPEGTEWFSAQSAANSPYEIIDKANSVAKIGNAYYATLQAAVDACAAGDNTITLLNDCDEDVIIKQVEGVNITIDGEKKTTFSGTFTIHGNARYTGEENLTFKDIKFTTSEAGHYFIDSNSTGSVERYAHNVTVDGCYFEATGDAVNSAAAMRIRQGFDIKLSRSIYVNMHSALQAYGCDGVAAEALQITGKNGISLGTSKNVAINDCEITATGYGIRADGTGAYNATVTGGTISAELPIVVRNTTGAYILTVEKANLTGSNEKGYGVIFTNGDDDEAFAEPTGAFKANIDESVKVYPTSDYVAKIGDKHYTSFASAIAAVKNGETITLLTDCAETVTITQKADLSFTINGTGKTYTGTINVNGNKRSTGAETLTIQNVNFVAEAAWQSSIFAVKSSQVHNLTVDGCTFTGTDAKQAYGIRLNHAYNITVKNTTGTMLYDLVYAQTALSGFTAEDVNVTESGMGFMLPYGKNLSFKNVTVEASGAGVGIYNYNASSATFEDCTFTANPPVYLGEKSAANAYTLTFNGANTLVATGEEGNLLEVAGKNAPFKVVVNDEALVLSKSSGLVAQLGNVYYNAFDPVLTEAKSGDIITVYETVALTEDGTLDLKGARVNAAATLSNTPVFRVLSDVTVTNGIVDGGSGINSYAFIVGNNETAGTLSIADGTYRGITSAISITNGVANISGGTFQTKHDGEGTDYGTAYMLNCIDSAYAAGTAKFNITGGTFKGFNPADNAAEGEGTNFVAEGYAVNANLNTSDNIYRYVVVKPMVEMDGKYYATIKDALATLVSADTTVHTVKVLQDLDIDVNYSTYNYPILVNGFSIVLDLNGKTITADWSKYTGTRVDNALIGVANGGKLDIIDSVGGGKIVNGNDGKDDIQNRIFWIITSTAAKSVVVNIEAGTFVQEDNVNLLYVQGNKPSDNLAPIYVNIKGGHYVMANESFTDFFNSYDGYQQTTVISGGTFNIDPTDWELKIAEGFAVVENENGIFAVTEISNYWAAQIGETKYSTLENAVNACVAGDNTIVLLKDCAENVTIKQTAGVNITIDGAGKNYFGTITVDGGRRNTGAETLTIQHVNFVAEGQWQSSIIAKENTYVHNLTVDGCRFIGNDAKQAYGISLRHAYNITVKNTTGTKLYDLVYAPKAVTGFAAENVTVTDSGMGFMLPYGMNLSFKAVAIEASGAGVGIYNYNASSATFEDCTITAATPIVLQQQSQTKAYTLILDGTNKFTATDGDVLLSVVGADAMLKVVNNTELVLTTGNTSGLEAQYEETYYNTIENAIKDVYQGVLPENVCIIENGNGFKTFADVTVINTTTNVGYATLSDAIAAVKNGETIKFVADTISKDVTIKQTKNLSFTIDGAGKTYTGTITVDGGRRNTGAETLTIKNVKFVAQGEWQSSIFAAKNTYVHNLTVEGCTFTGTDAKQAYGIRLHHAYNITVKDTTGTKLYDLVYGQTAVAGLTAENVTVTESGMGFMLPYGKNLSFKNVTIEASGAGVGIYNNNASSATFEDCTIKASTPVWLEQKNASNAYTLAFNGTNNFTASDGNWLKVVGKDTVLSVIVNDAGLDIVKTSGLTAQIADVSDVYYNTIESAAKNAEAGETIHVICNTTEDPTFTKTLNLAAGDYTLLGTITVNEGAELTILSGTFNDQNAKQYVVDGKVGVDNGDGTWTVKEKKEIVVTINDITHVAGNPEPEVTYTYEGAIEGDEFLLVMDIADLDFNTVGERDITATGYVFMRDEYYVTVVPGTLTVLGAVARIGDVNYATLAEAIAEVKDGESITLLADCAENVTIKQTKNLSFTIDGAGKTYTGTITVDGSRRNTGAETLTIKNVKFVAQGEWQSSIFAEKNTYVHNLTVDGCTFTGTDAKQAYGIRLHHAYNITVKNTTGTKLYDLVYGQTAVAGLTAENVTVTESGMGFMLPYGKNLSFKNVTIEASGAGVGIYNYNASSATFEDCTIKASTPVWLEQKNASNAYTLTFNGTNSLTATNEDGNLLVVDGTDVPFMVVVYDAGLKLDETNTDGLVAYVDVKGSDAAARYYSNKVQKVVASAQDNDTVYVIADAEENITVDQILGLEVGENELLGTITVAEGAALTIYSGTFNDQAAKQYVVEGMVAMDIEDGKWTVTDPVTAGYVAHNTTTKEYFKTVADAMGAALEGETVIMINNSTESTIVAVYEATLDLNGFTVDLKRGIISFDGHVVDNSESNSGLLKGEKKQIVLDEDNKQLPVWTEDGYQFVEITAYNVAKNNGKFVFQVKFEPYAHELLLTDGAFNVDSGVSIHVRVNWTHGDEPRTQDFIYGKDMIAKVLNSYDPVNDRYAQMFTLTIDVPEGVTDLTYSALVKSAMGTEHISESIAH